MYFFRHKKNKETKKQRDKERNKERKKERKRLGNVGRCRCLTGNKRQVSMCIKLRYCLKQN